MRGLIAGVDVGAALEREAAAADAAGDAALEALELGDPLVDARLPGAPHQGPRAAVRRLPARELPEELGDLVQGEPDLLREHDERDPPQHATRIASVPRARTDRLHEAALLVIAERRRGDAAAPGDLSDGQNGLKFHDFEKNTVPTGLQVNLSL